jgi:transcriptional regulator with XRE-family HTH domain
MSRIIRTHTPLGALIAARDVSVGQVVRDADIPRARMSEYLAGKTPISRAHLQRIAAYFQVEPENLQTPEYTIRESLRAFGHTYNYSRR